MENSAPNASMNPFNADNFNSEKLNSVDRLEAFSDGVFGVAITLLVLNIRVPLAQDIQSSTPSTLANALLQQWPIYLSYVLSFFTIGIVWANHHRTFTYISHADHTLRMLNLFLLMTVTLIPFTTQLLSTYIQPPSSTANVINDGQTTAAFVYALGWVLLSIAYNLLWRYAIAKKLVHEQLTATALRNISRRVLLGLVLYLVAAIGAFFNAFVGVALCFALAVFYLVF